jgi:hypothetical protein
MKGSRTSFDRGKNMSQANPRQVILNQDLAFIEVWIRAHGYEYAERHGFFAAYQRSMSNSNLKAGGPGYSDEMIAEAEAADKETRATRWLYQAVK